MKRFLIALVALGAVVALSIAGCVNLHLVRGTGDIVKTNFDFKDFTDIEAGYAFVVEVVQSNTFSVEVSTRQNIVPYLDVVQTGNTVRLRLKSGSYTNTDLSARITLPSL